MKLKILSCVPSQRYQFNDKVTWIEQQVERHKPDIVVCPQEYHSGIQSIFFKEKTDECLVYEEEQVVEPYLNLAAKYDIGLAVGAVVKDKANGQHRERIWVIDGKRGISGHADKMMLPAYDHIKAGGKAQVSPEDALEARAVAFDCKGARVSILFCWEVFSSYIWHAISRAQPDMVFSMIKFGVCGWPQKEKKNGESLVTGFGFGSDGGWIERLQMAARWDTACPIVCSTNSWDLPNRAGALAGVILPWEEKTRHSSLWNSKQQGRGHIQEHVQVDEVDYLYWRMVRENKFAMHEVIGEWPSSEARGYTMSWKVKRMERQFAGLPRLAAGDMRVKTQKPKNKEQMNLI